MDAERKLTAKERRIQKKTDSIKANMETTTDRNELQALRSNLAKIMSGKGLLGHFKNA